MDAHLVFERVDEDIVAGAERTIGVHQEFRDEEERDAARSGRCIRQAGEDEVDDVVGGVVFAPGDEDLLAEDAVGAVIAAFGAALQRPDVRTGMRLGQIHRAGPFAGDQLRQVGLLQFRRAMGAERLDCTHRQRRAEREGGGAGIPHFEGRDIEQDGQPLPAEFFRPGQAVPAAGDPFLIELRPAIRGFHLAIDQAGTLPVADLGKRGDFFGCETAGFVEDRIDEVFAEIAEDAAIQRILQTSDMLQGESDILDGRLVHLVSSHLGPARGKGHPPLPELIDFYVNVNFVFGSAP